MTCLGCRSGLPPGEDFLCPDCLRLIYPDWEIEFVEIGRKKGVRLYDVYAKPPGPKWVKVATTKLP